MTNRSLHAVLVERTGPRLLELLAAALDGSGPAIAPVDAGLPASRLDDLLDALAPDTVEDPWAVTTARSGQTKGVAEGTAVVIGTSGSTGMPKGVELSAAALLHSARASLARLGARPGERWLCCLPATHIAGLQVLVRSLVSGTDPVLADRADAETMAACGCAHVSLVPTQLQRLLADRYADIPINRDISELLDPPGPLEPLAGFSSVLVGGAAAPAALLDAARAAGVPVVTTYGMTETCGGCVYDGIPLDGVRVKVDDGRIWIGGPVLFSGYLGEPRGGGWFRTGDLGHLDASGRLTVRGRADGLINTGGHKVVPGEVASALQDCPGVRDVAVLGQPDPEWGERVIAVVVPADPAHPPTLQLLRLHVRERLPRYAAPSRVVVVDAVPVLPSGKHDIARLSQEVLRREQTEAESVS